MMMPRDRLMEDIDELLRNVICRHLRPGPPLVDPHMAVGHIRCLRAVGELGDPAMCRLAEALELHPSTVTSLVDALVERGLLERRADADDRRVVRVALTTEGKRRRAQVREAMRARTLDLLGDIPDDDLQRIHDALALLRDAMLRRSGAEGTCGARDETAARDAAA